MPKNKNNKNCEIVIIKMEYGGMKITHIARFGKNFIEMMATFDGEKS